MKNKETKFKSLGLDNQGRRIIEKTDKHGRKKWLAQLPNGKYITINK